MEKIVGIGGVFFKSKDPKKLQEWYEDKLGIEPREGYIFFRWPDIAREKPAGYTLWAPFPADTEYFKPSKAPYMINFVVSNLELYLAQIKKKGVDVEEKIEETPQGKFSWIMDPEGNRIEFWEPPE